MKTEFHINTIGNAELILTPETAGEQRMIDYLVMSRPLDRAHEFGDGLGEIQFRARHEGHHTNGLVKELTLLCEIPRNTGAG